MQSIPVVFTGISLSLVEARGLLPADIRPPAKLGDLDQLGCEGVVAIIDGELDSNTMLPTDEIRRAIARGLDVRGASSVGAFRAAELQQSGMAGAGWVYDAFLKRRIAGTDEIAVAYDPHSYRPLTIPLVNVRFCLDGLVSGSITSAEASNAMAALKRIKLEQRDRRTVLLRLADIFGKPRLKAALKAVPAADTDIKARDARNLLRTLGADLIRRPHRGASDRGAR
jgi:hypothetical protein